MLQCAHTPYFAWIDICEIAWTSIVLHLGTCEIHNTHVMMNALTYVSDALMYEHSSLVSFKVYTFNLNFFQKLPNHDINVLVRVLASSSNRYAQGRRFGILDLIISSFITKTHPLCNSPASFTKEARIRRRERHFEGSTSYMRFQNQFVTGFDPELCHGRLKHQLRISHVVLVHRKWFSQQNNE